MIDKYRAAYFHLLDKAVAHSGNSKRFLHGWLKDEMFPFLREDPSNFNKSLEEVDVPLTTTDLSEKGWKTFYEECRHFCIDKFNI